MSIMPQTLSKIQRSFSAAAEKYDTSCGLHREIAGRLAAVLTRPAAMPAAVLDAGCGTGYLTALMADRFPGARVIGLDFARGMLEAARLKRPDLTWLLGDIHKLPFSDGRFGLLVSNLSYQWSGDISRAFAESRRVLAPGGVLAGTLFGYHTCHELFESLHEAASGTLQFHRLPDETMVRDALISAGFKNPEIKCEPAQVPFKDMYELMFWLKAIGANNLPRDGHVGKQAMARAADIYVRRFASGQGVQSTFEVIWVYAQR
jgi:malonyl-CoA O-methyltransferase